MRTKQATVRKHSQRFLCFFQLASEFSYFGSYPSKFSFFSSDYVLTGLLICMQSFQFLRRNVESTCKLLCQNIRGILFLVS